MSKLTKAAKGQSCTVRVPRVCNFDDSTTVSAHLGGVRFGHGTGIKVSDILTADTCSACHDAIDGRVKTEFSKQELELMHLQGIAETLLRRVGEGLIKCA